VRPSSSSAAARVLPFPGSNAHCTGDDATIFCGAVLDVKPLGLKLRLFTRQQSFVDTLDENNKFFPAI
jgi:hypothetical protein